MHTHAHARANDGLSVVRLYPVRFNSILKKPIISDKSALGFIINEIIHARARTYTRTQVHTPHPRSNSNVRARAILTSPCDRGDLCRWKAIRFRHSSNSYNGSGFLFFYRRYSTTGLLPPLPHRSSSPALRKFHEFSPPPAPFSQSDGGARHHRTVASIFAPPHRSPTRYDVMVVAVAGKQEWRLAAPRREREISGRSPTVTLSQPWMGDRPPILMVIVVTFVRTLAPSTVATCFAVGISNLYIFFFRGINNMSIISKM